MTVTCPQCRAQQEPARFCRRCGVGFFVAPISGGGAGKVFAVVFQVFAAIIIAGGGLLIYAVAGWHSTYNQGVNLLLNTYAYPVEQGRAMRFEVSANRPVDIGVIHADAWQELRQSHITEAQAMATAYCSQFNTQQAKLFCDIPESGASDMFLIGDPRTTTSIAATTAASLLHVPGIQSEGFSPVTVHVESAFCQIFCGRQ